MRIDGKRRDCASRNKIHGDRNAQLVEMIYKRLKVDSDFGSS